MNDNGQEGLRSNAPVQEDSRKEHRIDSRHRKSNADVRAVICKDGKTVEQ